jgi:hypothetical protein
LEPLTPEIFRRQTLSKTKSIYHAFGLKIASGIPFLDMPQIEGSPDVTIVYGKTPESLSDPKVRFWGVFYRPFQHRKIHPRRAYLFSEIIHPFFQFFPDFKKWQFLGRHRNGLPSFGIPSLIGFIFFNKKRTQSPDFNPITLCKRRRDLIKKYINYSCGFFFGNLAFIPKFVLAYQNLVQTWD